VSDELGAILQSVHTDHTVYLFGLQPRSQLREPVNKLMRQVPTLLHRARTFESVSLLTRAVQWRQDDKYTTRNKAE
jgi:hypothetical protein